MGKHPFDPALRSGHFALLRKINDATPAGARGRWGGGLFALEFQTPYAFAKRTSLSGRITNAQVKTTTFKESTSLEEIPKPILDALPPIFAARAFVRP